MSQCSDILDHIRKHGSITPLDANRLYGCLALHSRISELRERGHAILTEMVNTPSGKIVGRYTLSVAAPAAPKAVADTVKVAAAEPHERLITTTGRSADGKRTYPLQFVSVGPGPGWPPDQDAARRSRRG